MLLGYAEQGSCDLYDAPDREGINYKRSHLPNHQGAIGAGIDLATGRTLTAVWRNSVVRQHPDTLADVTGVQIPWFDRMLDIAAGCNEMTNLGHVGVDLVLDRNKGPLMLELNARPGLNIQIANRAGLGARLEAVDRAKVASLPRSERIAFAKGLFGIGGKLHGNPPTPASV